MWLVTVAARSSWLPTRTMAARSQSPATEYTSLMPSRSARVSAVSEVRSTSQVISTIAVTMCAPDGPRPPLGGRLLVCVPGGYSTRPSATPAARRRAAASAVWPAARRLPRHRRAARPGGGAAAGTARASLRSPTGLARREAVPLAPGVVADLEAGAPDPRAGEPPADLEHLDLPRHRLQPRGDQMDLVREVARQRPVEAFDRSGTRPQALHRLLVAGGQHGRGRELTTADHRDLAAAAPRQRQHQLLGAEQRAATTGLGQRPGERLQPVPSRRGLLVALLGRVGGHAPPQRPQQRLGVAAVQGRLQAAHDRPVRGLLDTPGAGPEA